MGTYVFEKEVATTNERGDLDIVVRQNDDGTRGVLVYTHDGEEWIGQAVTIKDPEELLRTVEEAVKVWRGS
jgi:hypothetical protein